ncbi:MAG: SdrD B-like domain-containing protein [Anaerolineales bacterium]
MNLQGFRNRTYSIILIAALLLTGKASAAHLLGDNAGIAPLTSFETSGELDFVATTTPTAFPESATGDASGDSEEFCYGPDPEDFPEGISPLSGLPMEDASLLDLRPVFLSVSVFPPKARPPTGLSVSPIVYELYIGDGDTRLMAGFHGEFPQPSYEAAGGEEVDVPESFQYLIGDRVWFDSNGNHLQDEGEPGVAGVPVRLLDINFNTVQETVTDASGHYYFALNDVAANTEFQIRFGALPSIGDYYWVNKDMGDDSLDSDVTSLGRTDFFDPTDAEVAEQLDFDAGVRQAYRIEGVRSGRVAYQNLQVNYCGCLVIAGADPSVAARINTCATAVNNNPNDIGGAGLDVMQLQAVAAGNSGGACAQPNLTGNLFCTSAPEGSAGQELYVEYNVNNINHFVYDAELGGYTWAKNIPSDNETYEVMTDRLNGETLTFENVIVLLVRHTSQNTANTIIDLDMDFKQGKAYIFRNGIAYEALWSTVAGEYEQETGLLRPVRFTDLEGNPFPLAHGQTWVNLLNAFDSVKEVEPGVWWADFDAPSYSP